MLTASDVVVSYGPAVAVDGVSLDVGAGEMVALVGPNGAGKTSLVRAISALIKPSSGTIHLEGVGALVPEGRQLFADLTVDDNLRLGAWRRKDRRTDRIYDLFPDLHRLRSARAGNLSGGQQQMVSIGRALMAEPDLLVIDELSLGLAPMVVAELAEYLSALNRDQRVAILLIEQEVGLAFDLCARGYVMEAGRIALSGPTEMLKMDDHVRAVYFGGMQERTSDAESSDER